MSPMVPTVGSSQTSARPKWLTAVTLKSDQVHRGAQANGGSSRITPMPGATPAINAECRRIDANFKKSLSLSLYMITQERAGEERHGDRYNRVPADTAGSICIRWINDAGTAQTQARRCGSSRFVCVEES